MLEPKKKARAARMRRTNPKKNVSPTSLFRSCVERRESLKKGYEELQYVHIEMKNRWVIPIRMYVFPVMTVTTVVDLH